MDEFVTIKSDFKNDIRKRKYNQKIDFKRLKEDLTETYGLQNKEFDLQYIDEEGDKITIANEIDLKSALEYVDLDKNILKIYLKEKTKTKESKKENKGNEELIKIEGLSVNPKIDEHFFLCNNPNNNSFHHFDQYTSTPSTFQPFNFHDQENTKPMLKLQPPKNQQTNFHDQENTKPMLKLQPPKNQQTNFHDQENTKPMLKLQPPKNQEQMSFHDQENTKSMLKLQPPKNQETNFHDQENTKPMLKLQPPKNQETNFHDQENTKPILKLQPPKNQEQMSFHDQENTKPMLKLQPPKSTNEGNIKEIN